MTTYTSVFGSETIPPSRNGYSAVALTADTTFYWPELASGSNLMADIMEVTPTAAWTMTFPAANGVSTGRDVLVRNLGSFTITIHDNAGGTIGTVAAGVAKYLYITNNSTAAGSWTVFTFGTGTSAADAATLAGYGIVATGSTLSQQALTISSAVTTTVTTSQRAETLIFTNSGVVTCNMPLASSAGNGFFINISNQGTGTVTIDPSGAETIDGATTKDLAPGESLTAVCSGTAWASIGYGRSTQFQFTKLVLDISAGSPFTLSSVQAANKLIQTIGVITAGVTINVPAVVAVYYVECSHTGAFTTTIKTAAGTGVNLASGDRSILYCDGVNVVAAQTASAPAANLSGGVAGSIVYQSAPGVTGFSAAGTTGNVAISGGTGSPTWSDLGLITHAYSAKTPIVDADEFPLADSAAAYGPKRTLWSTIKAVIGYSAPSTSKATPVDADSLPLFDSAATTTATKLTWANLKTTLSSTFLALTGGTLTGKLLFKSGTNNIASAATVDLTAATSNTAHITGVTGISAFTMTSGQVIDLIFDGILTLTHHATNNNLPGGANITTAANDRACYWYDGTAVWCLLYQRANGTALVSSGADFPANTNITSMSGGGSQVSFTNGLKHTAAMDSQAVRYAGDATYHREAEISKNFNLAASSSIDVGTCIFPDNYSMGYVTVEAIGITGSGAQVYVRAIRRVAMTADSPVFTTIGTDDVQNCSISFSYVATHGFKAAVSNSTAANVNGSMKMSIVGGGGDGVDGGIVSLT